jgi:hypothetical protein
MPSAPETCASEHEPRDRVGITALQTLMCAAIHVSSDDDVWLLRQKNELMVTTSIGMEATGVMHCLVEVVFQVEYHSPCSKVVLNVNPGVINNRLSFWRYNLTRSGCGDVFVGF